MDQVVGDAQSTFIPPAASQTIPDSNLDQSIEVASEPDYAFNEHCAPPKTLTYLNCLALVVGLQIGSGIFSAPAVVSSHVSSPVTGVLVWAVAGALVWTGAASFIELGTIVPENGGIQEYLRHCYGDVYGFLFAWMWIVVVKPCSMAMVSLIFSEYLYKSIWPNADISTWILKATALVGVSSITALNCMGTTTGVGMANAFMAIKLLGLSSIAVLGPVSWAIDRGGNGVSGSPNRVDSVLDATHTIHGSSKEAQSTWETSKDLADALFAALFSYGGWESISFIVGEMVDPSRNLPRVLNHAMWIVISLSVMASISFYIVLPMEVLKNTNAIALAFGSTIFGQPGALFYALVVSLSCLGALHATVFSMGRLTQSAGARRYLPALLKTAATLPKRDQWTYQGLSNGDTPTNPISRTTCPEKVQNVPRNAMILNACLSLIYILTGSFRGLLNFKGMTEYLFYFATVSGVLLLRRHSRHFAIVGPVPVYHTSLINPLLFCLASATIVLRSAIAHAMQIVVIVLFFGCGTTIYRLSWWQKLVGKVDLEVRR